MERPSKDLADRAAALVAKYRLGGVKGHNARSEVRTRVAELLGDTREPDFTHVALLAVAEHLDAEAERRAAWEAKVEAFARAQGVEL